LLTVRVVRWAGRPEPAEPVAAAVTARLPHPSSRADTEYADRERPPASVPRQSADHHDVLLRRLRELGELHRDGVLTDEEFTVTKAAVLRSF
ncbi:SHOCT domain-containing protein, partial [Streptomyces sp. NPDC005921]